MRLGARRGASVVFALLGLLAPSLVAAASVASLAPQVAPPPTPVPPNGSPSPFVSRLRTPADPLPVPRVEAPTALLVDLGTDQVLVAKEPGRARPVASLTKLMTALLVLEREGGDLDRMVTVPIDAVYGRGDYGASSALGLTVGERVSVRDLLAGLLVGSANDAAEALAIDRSGSVEGFVRAMNARARRLGLRETRFASPHGLDDRGRSTALDLLRLLEEARTFPLLRDLVGRRVAILRSGAGPVRRIQNRNVMLWLYPGTTGVKTGSTAGAGACLIATARRGDRELAAILLGGPAEVFSDAAALFEHGFSAYERRTVVRDGESLGSVPVRGGEVPVVAGRALSALVRTAIDEEIDRVMAPARGVAYPPPPGSVVGTLHVRSSGVTLGRVPVLAADVGPPPEPAGAWWSRAGGAIARAVVSAIDGLFG